MAEFKVEVRNPEDKIIGEFDSFKKVEFGKRLNNYGTATLTFPISNSRAGSLYAARRNTIWIYRDKVLRWAGEMALRKGNMKTDGNDTVSIYCFDWLEQFRNRKTAKEVVYTQVDQGEIFWDQIDKSQQKPNGDFGIRRGTITPTKKRNRKYYSDEIMELGINLSNVIDGFDFEITNSRLFNIYPTIGVYRGDSFQLEHGRNMHVTEVIEDFTNPVNRAIVLGDAIGQEQLTRVESDAPTEQQLYKLREDIHSELTISEEETFEEKGDAMLQKFKTPLIKLNVNIMPTVNISQFALGDTIPIIFQRGFYNIVENYRVYEWKLTFDSNNQEKLSVIFGKFTL